MTHGAMRTADARAHRLAQDEADAQASARLRREAALFEHYRRQRTNDDAQSEVPDNDGAQQAESAPHEPAPSPDEGRQAQTGEHDPNDEHHEHGDSPDGSRHDARHDKSAAARATSTASSSARADAQRVLTAMRRVPRVTDACATNAATDTPAQDHTTNRLFDWLAEHTAQLCANAGASLAASWQVRLALDPAVLRACSLELALSQFGLALRFTTADADTASVLYRHRTTLRTRLDAALARREARAPRIDIDIIFDPTTWTTPV